MKKKMLFLSFVWMLAGVFPAGGAPRDLTLYQVATGRELSLSEATPALLKSRVIVIGEIHDRKKDHQAQLAVIRALREAGARVAVGLEMIQSDSQGALDRWVNGEMERGEFEKVYHRNWSFPWTLYGRIFEYAREEKIPMVGLNVPPEITRQVALEGFQSLSKGQKEKLPNVVCQVDPEYMAFIKRAYADHAHGHFDFTNFCEAQLLWNEAMAAKAVQYLKGHPETTMVLLTGMGHARKRGIPEQIEKRSNLSCTILLPEVKGYMEPGTANAQDGDYILMASRL